MSTSFSFALLRGTLTYHLGGRFVAWLYHICPLNKNHAKKLYKTLESLSQKAGVKIPEISLMESSRPSIFSVGRKAKSTVVVSVGVLETLSSDEIEAAFAHEISHIKNKNCLIKSLASSFKFAVPFNFLGYLIEPAISRDREFLADEESVKMTNKTKALISALIKLYESFLISQKNKLSAGFPISFLALRPPRWYIFSKHPPIAERVRRLFEFENNSSRSTLSK